jgi:asparagine synthase (glutamine-hydrolysing)
MVARLGHRGPDASGTRAFDRCSLGHTRLRIIDLSPLADQPLANEDDTAWVVFNGEIYNFRELRAQLAGAGHSFRSASDTEVLVHLYEEHGDDMVRHLRGMFAFAIWDERRRRLLLCRDRLGIKPLYYRVQGGALSFASEVRALSAPTDPLDLAALRAVLRLGWIPGPRTIRSGVSELLPGHQLVWEDGNVTIRRYWSAMATTPDAPTAEEAAGVLQDAIRRHLVADVPVGLFLSAGVDSVVLAELARREAPDLRAYTVAFETAADESTDAGAIAARLGLRHTIVPVGISESLASVGRFVRDMDQPTVDGLNSWIISRAVREAGLVVALSGVGGDELFCGYSTFRHVPRLAAAGRTARALGRWPGALADTMGRTHRVAHSRARRALEGVASGGWADAYASVRGVFGESELNRIWPAGRELAEELVTVPPEGGRPDVAVVGSLEMANYLPFQLLRDTDCMSMAHALEVRVPLLDDDVVDLGLRGQASVGRAWDKHRLVEAVDPGLSYLVDLPKRTFTLPIADWMRGGLSGVVEDSIVRVGESDLGFSRRALTDLWHDYLGGLVGWRSVWGIAVLGMWLDCHTGAPALTSPTRAP